MSIYCVYIESDPNKPNYRVIPISPGLSKEEAISHGEELANFFHNLGIDDILAVHVDNSDNKRVWDDDIGEYIMSKLKTITWKKMQEHDSINDSQALTDSNNKYTKGDEMPLVLRDKDMSYLVMSSTGAVAVFVDEGDATEYIDFLNINHDTNLTIKEIETEDIHEYI